MERKNEYRYRNDRSTKANTTKFAKILPKLGRIRYVKGIAWKNIYGVTQEAVIVRGENGYARFGGLLWGYYGEGPRGLADLLEHLGFNKQDALSFAYNTVRDDNPPMGEQWLLDDSFFNNEPIAA
jgi:hypothetical protein